MSKKSMKKQLNYRKKETPKQEANAQQEGMPEAQAPGPDQPSLADMLKDILSKEDAHAIEQYTAAVLQKFGRYIKSVVLWGSKKTKKVLKKNAKPGDIDVAIIVDDTDVRRMTRAQLKDKLFQRLCEMSHPISKNIHPQPYLLTEFWQYVMDGNPVIYNVLRDGIIIFDNGFFMPLQMLMRMGNIKPSKEAIDKHMYIAEQLLFLCDDTLLTKMSYDLEQAVVSSAQAVLMELGYRPPTPNETPTFVMDFLVKEKKLLPEKFAEMAEKVIRNYKDIEHKEKKKFTGTEYEAMMVMAKEFVDKMKELLTKIRKEKGESYLFEQVEKQIKAGKEEKTKVTRPTDIDLSKAKIGPNQEDMNQQLGQR